MEQICIRGGRPLQGVIPIGGAKNAALPLMVASLLTDETLTLGNLPHVVDITTLANLLRQHGVTLTLDGEAANGGHSGRALSLTAEVISNTTAPYDLVRKMRASVLVLGPLLARAGEAKVSLPGGCAIGNRPVDLHLTALEQLGAEIELADGYIVARAPHGLKGAEIQFPTVSVGATQDLLMAACLARGETVLANAAREPEVCDLARCLVAMGARIEGIGGDRLEIAGVSRLPRCRAYRAGRPHRGRHLRDRRGDHRRRRRARRRRPRGDGRGGDQARRSRRRDGTHHRWRAGAPWRRRGSWRRRDDPAPIPASPPTCRPSSWP